MEKIAFYLVFFILPTIPFFIIFFRKLKGQTTRFTSASKIGLIFLFLIWVFNLIVCYITFIRKD